MSTFEPRPLRRLIVPLVAILALFLVLGLALVPHLPDPPAARSGDLLLSDVILIEPGLGRSSRVGVRVRDGRLAELLPAEVSADGAPTRFVLPGLIDMHSHLAPDTPLQLGRYFGLLNLLHGVTTRRHAGDVDGSADAAARRAARAGYPMPRLFSCGPFIVGGASRWENSRRIERAEQADELVRGLAEQGHVCIKVYDDLPPHHVRALVAAAERYGVTAIGHVAHGSLFEEVLIPDTQHLMGVAPADGLPDHVVDRVYDWTGVDEARIQELVRISRDRNLRHTPTLVAGQALMGFRGEVGKEIAWMPSMYRDVVWHPQKGVAPYRDLSPERLETFAKSLPLKQRAVRDLWEAGVTLHLGTDTPQPFVVPGAALQGEMRLFVEAGIPLEEVWAMATWKSGAYLGEESLGRLTPGAPADLLIFRQDPTQSLHHLESLEAVVVAGQLYRVDDLRESLRHYQRYYAHWLLEPLAKWIARRQLEQSVLRDS